MASSFMVSLLRSLLYPTLVLLILAFMPGLPPYDVSFEHLDLSNSDMDFEGPLAFNNRLSEKKDTLSLSILGVSHTIMGPESFAGRDDFIYTGIQLGLIVRRNVSAAISEPWEFVLSTTKEGKVRCVEKHDEPRCSRPLGMQFDTNGKLIVADAYRGLLEVDVDKKQVVELVSKGAEVEGQKLNYVNSVAVADDVIYFTEASSKFELHESMLESLIDGSGRLIKYDRSSGSSSVLMSGLIYANGVSLSPDKSFLVVAEVNRGKLWRYNLQGEGKHSIELFAHLPGLPDNIKPNGLATGFMVGIVAPTLPNASKWPRHLVIENKWSKRMLARILFNVKFVLGKINESLNIDLLDRLTFWMANTELATRSLLPPYGLVVELDLRGQLVQAWHGAQEEAVCEGFHYRGHVYLGSPYRRGAYRVPYNTN